MGPGVQISLDVTSVAEAVERAEMAVRPGVDPGVHVMGDHLGLPDSVEGVRLREVAAVVGIR